MRNTKARTLTARYWFIAACSILGTLMLVSARQSATRCLEWGTRLVDPASGPMDPAVPEEADVCLREIPSGRYEAPLNSDYAIWWGVAFAAVGLMWWMWENGRTDGTDRAGISQD